LKTTIPYRRIFYIAGQVIIAFLFCFKVKAANPDSYIITVSKTGTADFKTIQEAINSLPDTDTIDRYIFIKNGVYAEKVFITKNHVLLYGEDKTKTILTASIARDGWRCTNPDDWGVATLNLKGNDITLQNLTITNSCGFDWTADKLIDCPGDTSNPKKKITKDGHQMALRSFGTTRLAVVNCILRAWAGDTVSPWNTEDGMFYFKDCTMEGGVDFFCPRGWSYAENCTFFANRGDAAIWHDGSKYEDSKTVLKNCTFNGYDGFKLGRYHRDAQFYLVGCTFANNMADKNIYLVNTTNTIQWGERIYYANCHRTGGDYGWFRDNLVSAKGSPAVADIKPAFVFGKKWVPKFIYKLTTSTETVVAPKASYDEQITTDPIAENMLMFQRNNGGWNKHLEEKAVNYNKTYTAEEQAKIKGYATKLDATIDNESTTKEIKYLVKAYKKTSNKAYLDAAERGIQYLLSAQYANGGWPQYYPDKSGYRSQVTFNDNAIINVLTVMEDIVSGKNDFDAVNNSFKPFAEQAIQKATSCILATQIKVNGKLTAWCTQYNAKTLEPEMARKFELASISAAESVNIVRFLMRQPKPTPEIKQAIAAAIEWFKKVKITGYNYIEIADATQPKGKDRVIVEDPKTTIWARFYEIETNRPLFAGRDSDKKYNVAEVEYERRMGYAWYGNWPTKLLEKEYPEWLGRN
jgi:PelA/Pel-15E family pectate lyase